MDAKLFTTVIALVILGIVGSIGYVTFAVIHSNGETDYCYTEMWSPTQMAPQFLLQAHRPWRQDRMLGAYPSLEEAKAKADLLGCRLNVK